MKKSSLDITGNRLPGKVIYPATYQFSKDERILFDTKQIRRYKAVIVADLSRGYIKTPEVKGLATRFARLRTAEDVDRFAMEYGLLGIAEVPDSIYDTPVYGKAWFEPLSIWQHHIENVRRLLLLYRALSRQKKGYDVELDELLRLRSLASAPGTYVIQWYDGKDTGIEIERGEEANLAAVVLTVQLKQNLQGGINLSFSKIIPSKDAAVGFRIGEIRTTPFLLAAIYYDLWELITDSRPIITCGNCGLPIEKSGRRDYCNDACKQAAYRKRRKGES